MFWEDFGMSQLVKGTCIWVKASVQYMIQNHKLWDALVQQSKESLFQGTGMASLKIKGNNFQNMHYTTQLQPSFNRSVYGHQLHFRKTLVDLLSVFRRAESTRNQRELRSKSASMCLAYCEERGSTRQAQVQELHRPTVICWALWWCAVNSCAFQTDFIWLIILICESGPLELLVSAEGQILTQSWFNLIGDMLGFKHWHLTKALSDST